MTRSESLNQAAAELDRLTANDSEHRKRQFAAAFWHSVNNRLDETFGCAPPPPLQPKSNPHTFVEEFRQRFGSDPL